jgi:hypothetical protein
MSPTTARSIDAQKETRPVQDAKGFLAVADVLGQPHVAIPLCVVILALIIFGLPMLERPAKRRRH